MGRFARLAEKMAANADINVTFEDPDNAGTVADIADFEALELSEDVINVLNAHRPEERAVTIRPNKDGGGIDIGVDLLRALHSSKGTHAFEMRNINERVGFQYVMSGASARNKLVRQLAGFYPDSHIEVSEYDRPPLLPLNEGWYICGASFRLRRRENGEYLIPIRHAKNEGFDNDPYNSITSEMVGELESDTITNVALQVAFEPAPLNWYKGTSKFGIKRERGIDDIVDELKHPTESAGPKHILTTYLKNLGPNSELNPEDLKAKRREPTDEERLEAKHVLTQRGEKGYWINIRVFAVGESPEKAAQRVQETASMYEGYYDSTTEQGFEILPLSGEDLLAEAKRAHARERKEIKMVMDLIAASGLMHIPCDDINTQNVEWSMTSFAGDVPADAPRFSEFLSPEYGWEPEDRTHETGSGDWPYDISSTWDGFHTDKWEIEDAIEDVDEIEDSEANSDVEEVIA